jgi:cytochrome c
MDILYLLIPLSVVLATTIGPHPPKETISGNPAERADRNIPIFAALVAIARRAGGCCGPMRRAVCLIDATPSRAFDGCQLRRAFAPQTRHEIDLKPLGVQMKTLIVSVSAVLLAASAFLVNAADDAAAEALMKKSGCFKCHSVDKKKDGPSFHETATKMKGKADAEQELYKHLTTHPMVKIEGKEEKHASLKTTDDAQIKNVISWILSR